DHKRLRAPGSHDLGRAAVLYPVARHASCRRTGRELDRQELAAQIPRVRHYREGDLVAEVCPFVLAEVIPTRVTTDPRLLEGYSRSASYVRLTAGGTSFFRPSARSSVKGRRKGH